MEHKVKGRTLKLIEGDLTELDVDAIVNAADAQLIMGGGVAGAIRIKGGPSIQEECNAIGGTHVGGAVITGAGDLKARHVIHAVGPRWGEGDEENKLENAISNSLKLADSEGLKSIAFPAVSTGIFGFPLEPAAAIMVRTALEYLAGETGLEEVTFCLFDKRRLTAFEQALKEAIG